MSRAAHDAAVESLRREAREADPLPTGNAVELRLTFEVPAVCGSEANERRRMHADLAGMSAWELEAEGHRARLALCFGRFANPWQREWTRERLAACQDETRKRKGGQR